jgi:hypothetical protein
LPENKAENDASVDFRPSPAPDTSAFLNLSIGKRELARNEYRIKVLNEKNDRLSFEKDRLNERFLSEKDKSNICTIKFKGLESDKSSLLIIYLLLGTISPLAAMFAKTGNVNVGYILQVIASVIGILVAIFTFYKSSKDK